MPELDIRDRPTPEFIESVRKRFPVDADTDKWLTRKMLRRGGPPYSHPTLDELGKQLRSMLDEVVRGDYELSGLRWLTGGASKVQIAFDLSWADESGSRDERLVVRMDPAESANTTSRERETELLRAFERLLPVPKVFWLDADARWFAEPALVYGYVDGVTRPRDSSAGQVIGLGTDYGPHLRNLLAPQYLDALATIHTADIGRMSFTTMDVPAPGTTDSARLQLNRALRVWEEDRMEDFPLMDAAAAWLEEHLPVLDRASVVHGDFRSGNFLFDESSGQVTAWLDWERGHLGDRHRDLAWITQREKGHFAEDGTTYLVCGLIPADEFYDRYQEASGLTVDHERLKFYEVLNCFQIVTTTTATAARVAKLGKSHQDVLLARIRGVAPVVEQELLGLLED